MGHMDGFREFCERSEYQPDPAAHPKRRLERFMAKAEASYLGGAEPKAFDVTDTPDTSGTREYKVFDVKQSGRGHIIKMTPHATTAVMDDAAYRGRRSRGTDPRPGDTVQGEVYADGSFKSLQIVSRGPGPGR